MKKPSLITGALVGGLLTAPLMALFFLGDVLAGLPFVPLDVFDRLAKTLPGSLITFGIDRMIDIIVGLNLGRLDTAAKTAEQLTGLMIFLLIGVVVGVIFFAVRRNREAGEHTLPGIILGLVVGIPLLIVSLTTNATATASPVIGSIWTMILFLGWGAAVNWVYNDLFDLDVEPAQAESTGDVQRLSRRQFLVRIGGASATLTVVGAGVGALLSSGGDQPRQIASGGDTGPTTTDGTGNALPNSDASLMPAPGTRPEYTPLEDHYRIDISTRPPVIDGESWVLPIHGLVDNEVELTLDDLRNNYESQDQYVTLSCISNRIAGDLISTTKWTGVSMQHILDEIQPTDEAGYLLIRSADDFYEYVSLDLIREDPRIMLAFAWDDQPLRQKHGFPLRIWIPDRYGMKQPKWIVDIEVISEWDEGYWVTRGWSEEAIVKTTSVIDTVAVDSIREEGGESLLPIGGIAYSGAKGISRVEVQIDDGDWQEAQLRDPISETTWVIWRYDWPFSEGQHTFTVSPICW